METLVSLSIKLDIPLTTFFEPDADTCETVWESAAGRVDKSLFESMQRPRQRTIALLREAVAEFPPASLNDVAEKLGYRSTIPLYRADRVLCNQIRNNYLQYQESEERGQEDQPPTNDAIREALEKALLAENPSSLTDLAKQLGFFNVATVRGKYPDLCSAISRKRTSYRQRMLEIQKQVLILALAEDPVPSLPELKRRLGLKYYTTITERFPDLSEALVSERKDQRLHHLSSMRKVIEELLERPKLRWKDVIESTGKSRSLIAGTFPDLCARISSKNKDYLDSERARAIELANIEIRRVVDDLLNKGLQPSIERVWRAIPKRASHGKTMVERILRSIRNDETASLE